MKYRLKEYAKALADLLDGSKVSDKELVGNFLSLLQKNNELKNAKRIISLAQEYFLKKRGNKKITLETARPSNNKAILKNIENKGDIVEEKVNPELVAGIKIVIDENKQLDFSMNKRLNETFNL